MKKDKAARAVFRKDYTPYPWILRSAGLRFEIGNDSTRVFSTLSFEARPGSEAARTIELDGKDMELVSVARDGTRLEPGGFELGPGGLSVKTDAGSCRLDLAEAIERLRVQIEEGDFLERLAERLPNLRPPSRFALRWPRTLPAR